MHKGPFSNVDLESKIGLVKLRDFEDFLFFCKSPDFYDKFQVGSQEYKTIPFLFFNFHIQHVAKFG